MTTAIYIIAAIVGFIVGFPPFRAYFRRRPTSVPNPDPTAPDKPKPELIHPTSPSRYYKVGLKYLDQLNYPNALE